MLLDGEKMKYSMRESELHTISLYRYGEKVSRLPSNAEIEFWYKIEELVDELKRLQEELRVNKSSTETTV